MQRVLYLWKLTKRELRFFCRSNRHSYVLFNNSLQVNFLQITEKRKRETDIENIPSKEPGEKVC